MSKITTSLLQEMVQAAATRLGKQAEYVNSLNVFPVPDGDTGTNMGMTMDNGAKAVAYIPVLSKDPRIDHTKISVCKFRFFISHAKRL